MYAILLNKITYLFGGTKVEEKIMLCHKKLRTHVKINCDACGKEFWQPKFRFLLGKHHFCSRKCIAVFDKQQRVKLLCATCGKEFAKAHNRLKHSKSGIHFCSRKCKDKAQRISGRVEIMPAHYGRGHGISHYRKMALDKYGKVCAHCGYHEYEKGLEVHHIDGNRKHNTLENLIVLCALCHCLVSHKILYIIDRKLIKK